VFVFTQSASPTAFVNSQSSVLFFFFKHIINNPFLLCISPVLYYAELNLSYSFSHLIHILIKYCIYVNIIHNSLLSIKVYGLREGYLIFLCLHGHLLGPGRFFQFPNLICIQSVGLLERRISPSHGRYLHIEQHKHRINAHRHPCL
jgi:hypothetical protein